MSAICRTNHANICIANGRPRQWFALTNGPICKTILRPTSSQLPAHTNLTRTPTGAQPLSTLIQHPHHIHHPHTHTPHLVLVTSTHTHTPHLLLVTSTHAHHLLLVAHHTLLGFLLMELPNLSPASSHHCPFPGPKCAGYAPKHPSRNSGGASVLHWHWLPDLHHHNAAGGCCRAEGSSTRPLPLLAL